MYSELKVALNAEIPSGSQQSILKRGERVLDATQVSVFQNEFVTCNEHCRARPLKISKATPEKFHFMNSIPDQSWSGTRPGFRFISASLNLKRKVPRRRSTVFRKPPGRNSRLKIRFKVSSSPVEKGERSILHISTSKINFARGNAGENLILQGWSFESAKLSEFANEKPNLRGLFRLKRTSELLPSAIECKKFQFQFGFLYSESP